MKRTVEAICTGTARPFNGAETSAIAKRPREDVVQILEEGLAPDEQADRRVHGGPEKAVHLYPLDHHAFWREQLDDDQAIALLDEPGAFGSNLAVRGMLEDNVHIGDRFRIGTAVLEVNQPRQPCWKVDHRFGVKGMTAKIVQTGRCGWYFRVLEIGDCQTGDIMQRIATGHTEWTVARTFAAIIAGKASRDDYAELAELDRLSPGMRAKAARKLT
ncbi:MAG: MOSC domain-containing protein [Erythrobacter sp.]|nr:MOSC domain-containing protein [Erythrobacter sp.]